MASIGKLRLSYLDFDGVRHISPSAALMLASELDRWNEDKFGRLKAQHDGWHQPVKKLLCEMGLFELLHMKRPDAFKDAKGTTFLPFVRGNVDLRTPAGEQAKKLRVAIEVAVGTVIKKHLLSDGLTEAATNVCHHAYRPKGKKAHRYKPWWISAAYDTGSDTVTVSFIDHGLTIPGTLPASEKMERWKTRMGAWDDGQRVRAAMTLGRSATGKSGRGRGLRNFLELLDGYERSKLTIISRSGRLTVENKARGKRSFKDAVLETSLKGTLIEWQFVPKTATLTSYPYAHLDR